MKNKKLFFIIMIVWVAIVIGFIISVVIIEKVTDYRFDAQLGLAIFFWGFLVLQLLLIMAGIHNLILYFISKGKK